MSQIFMDGGHDSGGAVFQGPGNESAGFDHSATEAGGPSQTPVWNSGIKGVKLSDMVQGINVTPNFMLAMLFLGFTAWLFVIYWIRHNEPLANQVLGTPAASAPTADADRALIDGVRNALPIRTSHKFGAFYTPDRKQREQSSAGGEAYSYAPDSSYPSEVRIDRNFAGDSGAALPFSAQTSAQSASTAQSAANQSPYPAHNTGMFAGTSHVRVEKKGREHVMVPHTGTVMMVPTFGQARAQGYAYPQQQSPSVSTQSTMHVSSSHYHVGVQTADGPKLRTVVNR
ncbi:MAG: hypothetical protein K8F91_07490 [Candidatus Obscuribacterales bacterium]|nr:hypothetical protein [Candidatus Obscuribacterales bacterium]